MLSELLKWREKMGNLFSCLKQQSSLETNFLCYFFPLHPWENIFSKYLGFLKQKSKINLNGYQLVSKGFTKAVYINNILTGTGSSSLSGSTATAPVNGSIGLPILAIREISLALLESPGGDWNIGQGHCYMYSIQTFRGKSGLHGKNVG